MSFFDDEPDEPTRVTRPARPRRAAAGARPHIPDPDVARRRQIALIGGLAVIAILLIFAVQSCRSTRAQNALKDYNRDVTSIVQSSDEQVSKQLFDVLSSSASGQPQDAQASVQQVRITAEEDVTRAKDLSVPGDMAAAQRNLELVLNLRATGVRRIADLLPRALSSQPSAQNAVRQLAGQMQAFLASDVVYSQRVAPLIQEALTDNDVGGQTIAQSKFLPSIAWLDGDQVAARVNPDASSSSSTGSGAASPGTHGHGLVSTAVGETALRPGTVVNRIPATAPLPVDATLANQGENDETNVRVNVKITGGFKTISQTKRLNQTKAGTNATVTVQLNSVPPRGSSAKITVTVAKVNGEKTTDNNTQTYTVLFT